MLAAELGSCVSQVECETVVDASVALLRAPPEVLRNFRVIGVVGSVLLVVDTATEGSFVIKVLAVLTTVFQVNLDQPVPRWFSSSSCSGRGPSWISGADKTDVLLSTVSRQ